MLGTAVTLLGVWLLTSWWAPAAGPGFPETGRAPAANTLAAVDVDARTEIPVRPASRPGSQSSAVDPAANSASLALPTSSFEPRGAPAAEIVSSPSRHDGGEFEVTIRFAEPVAGTPLPDWPHSLHVEAGEIRSLSPIDPSGFEWSARIAPQGRRSVNLSIARRGPCDGLQFSCVAPQLLSQREASVVVAGPPVTARVVERPTHHLAPQPVEFLLELDEPVWASLREIRDRAFRVANGRLIGVNRVDGRHDLWRVTLMPDTGADVRVVFSPQSGCHAGFLGCKGDLNRIVNEFEFSIPAARLYLTFDDGPHPRYTPQILDVLARYQAKATFFVVGSSAEAYPELIDRIVREGHTLANHTWDHESLDGISEQNFNETIRRTQELLGERATACMRPPYWAMDEHTVSRAAKLGLRVVLGEIRPRDWTKPGALEIANRLVASAAHGRIAVLHDGGGDRAQTVEGLELALAYLAQSHYVYEPVCK